MDEPILRLKTNIEVFNTFMRSDGASVGTLIVENVDEYNILKEYISIPDEYRPNMEITNGKNGLYLLVMTTNEVLTKLGSEDFYTFYFIFGSTKNVLLPSFVFSKVIDMIERSDAESLKRLKIITKYLFYISLKEKVVPEPTKKRVTNRTPDLPEEHHGMILGLVINKYEGNFKVRCNNTTYKVKAKWLEDLVKDNMLSYDDYKLIPLDLKGTIYRYISILSNTTMNDDLVQLQHKVSIYLLKKAIPIGDLVAAKALLTYCKHELKPRNETAYTKYIYKLYRELVKVNKTLSRYIKKEWL